MFRQGITKRGEAISPGSKNYSTSHHHSAVHSILHGKKDETGSSNSRTPQGDSDSSPPSSKKKLLLRKKSYNNSSGSSGSGNNYIATIGATSDDDRFNHHRSNSGGSDDESNTSLTLGSGSSWKKRRPHQQHPTAAGGGVIGSEVEGKGGGEGKSNSTQQQFPSPTETFGYEKRSYSFDVGKQQQQDDDNNNPAVMTVRKNVNTSANYNAGGAGAAVPHSSPQSSINRSGKFSQEEPPGISPSSSPIRTENKRSLSSQPSPPYSTAEQIRHAQSRSLSPRGAMQQQRYYNLRSQPPPPPLQNPDDVGNSDENDSQLRCENDLQLRWRSLSPQRVISDSPLARGRSRGRGDAREKAVKDMEEMDERFNNAKNKEAKQLQQRGRGSSLGRLGNNASKLLSRGRSGKRGKRSGEYSSPEKAISPQRRGDEDEGNKHVQASLMAVQMQPPQQSYSPLVSMPKKGNTRSITTQSITSSILSGDPLSQYDEPISGTGGDGNFSKKKKSRRQRLQSSVMKHFKHRSFGNLDKLKKNSSDATPVTSTDGSSTDRSGDLGADVNGSFNNNGSISQQGFSYSNITVYEDGSISSSLHRQSSTDTTSTTVSSMLPNANPHPHANNLEWNPAMSLLNKMSALQRIESFSGEEDSDYTESQSENDDLDTEEIFYDNEEVYNQSIDQVYQSCSHPLFQKQMQDEELDLSDRRKDVPSKDKNQFLHLSKKSMDNMVGSLMKKNRKKDDCAMSSESEPKVMKGTKIRRSRSLSLRRMISRGTDTKERLREEALRQALMNSQQYQEWRKQQQQQETEETEYRKRMLQRSTSVDAHQGKSRVVEGNESNLQYHRSDSLPRRNSDIAHSHALAALAAEASRRHRDRTLSDERRMVRKDSQDPPARRASFDSENSSLSSSSRKAQSLRRQKREKSKTYNCLVCHQRVLFDNKVDFMDFHFCLDCFRCACCRKSLVELDTDNSALSRAQVISNARGSIVQCGECVMQLGRTKAEPIVVSPIITKGKISSIKYCALCKSDFSGYKGEVQCIGVNNYHPECLRREKILVDSVGSRSLGSENVSDVLGQITPLSSVAGDELTPATAAQNVAEKATVRMTLVDNDGNMETSNLSNVFFVWPKKEEDLAEFEASEQDIKMEKFLRNDGGEVDLSVQVKYKIDMLKHQHNQFLILPQLASDVDGRITEKFHISLQFPDQPFVDPRPSGPALLSIEPFPSEKDSAKKVLRAAWSYECDGIQHEFRFIAPFNSPYGVAWEIFEGDELDFTSCKLDCFIDKMYEAGIYETNVHESSSRKSTKNACDWELRAEELLDEMDGDKKNGNSLKHVSSKEEKSNPIDTSTKSSVDSSSRTAEYSEGGMLVLHRKSRHVDPDREENDHFSELLSVASSADSNSIALPTIIHVAVEKNSDDEIGLCLIEKNGTTVVSEVSKSGMFQSKLTEGCELLSVNGHKVRSPRSFIRMMKDFSGKVVIMASSSPSPPGAKFIVVDKSLSSLGLAGEEEEQDIYFQKINGVLRVQGIKETGIFAEGDIGKGDLCLSIDGVPAISERVAIRALARAQGNVALLIFPMSNFWKSMVELTVDGKYDRWWKSSSECTLFLGNDNAHPVNLSFNEETGLCTIQDNIHSNVNVKIMNTIILRVMKVLRESIQSYITVPNKARDSSRSLSVSPSGKLQNRSDVYKRALVKLDEMRANGRLSESDYASAKRALTEVAINTSN